MTEFDAHSSKFAKIRIIAVTAGVAALAGCATAPPPPPPPPPPAPQAKVIPPRPVPPGGAAANMVMPAMGANGVRQTVNAGISEAQTIWNLRSALNVAALNCLEAQHASILPNYKSYLGAHSRQLRSTNTAVGREFREKHGRSYRDAQDTYMTQVYNYFALPPALDDFCDAAVGVSSDAAVAPRGSLSEFSVAGLSRLEAVFEGFYSEYEQYRVDLSAWDAEYGAGAATTAAPQPLPTEGPIFQPSPTVQGAGSTEDGG